MPRVLPFAILALLAIYCIVEVAQADSSRVRMFPRWLWAASIILLPAIGSVGWLIFGRPLKAAPPRPQGRPKAPDDDPDFLRGL